MKSCNDAGSSPALSGAVLGFAGYTLDTRSRRLSAPDGTPVKIASRAFETLEHLARHPHQLVEKRRLLEVVWPNAAVEENNLTQQIRALRKILGDGFIVTDPRRGYRFVHDVHRLDALPAGDDPHGPQHVPAGVESAARGNDSSLTTASLPIPTTSSYPTRRSIWRDALISLSALAILASSLLYLSSQRAGVATEHTYGAPKAVGTRNAEALQAYLAARALISRVGSTQSRDAITLLERSVQLDPNFALAWAALAEAYTYAADFPRSLALPLTQLEIQNRIARAALRALELAPDTPEALRSAGWVSMRNRDWSEAERRLYRAVQLAGPTDYDTNLHYGWFLMNVGRAHDAVLYIERAMRAEPLLLRPVTFRAALFEMQGQLEQAQSLLIASSTLQGSPSLLTQGLVMIGLARHDRPGLRRLLTEDGGRCATLDDPQSALTDLRRNYADIRARGMQAQLLPVADFAAYLGDPSLSLEALRTASRGSQNLHALWRPALTDVRRLPEFKQLVQDLGLVDYWRATGRWGDFCRITSSGELTCR